MFILDSLMIAGLRWTLQTVATAADAEMNDDGVLREQLLEAEMRREAGEISEERFRETEASLLRRIREIRERREGGNGPLAFQGGLERDGQPARVTVEAALTGEYHPPTPVGPRPASARQAPPPRQSPATRQAAATREAAATPAGSTASSRGARRPAPKEAVKTVQRKRRR